MAKTPKYKINAKSAYRYAKKNGVFSDEEEKIFIENPEIAVDYAINIKRKKLTDFVEDKVFKYYCESLDNTYKDQHEVLLNSFFKYMKMTKSIPEGYLNTLIEKTSPELLYVYSQILEKKLSDVQEKRMFEECKNQDNLWPIVEYQYACNFVPDYMHNFMLAKSLEEKDSSNKNAVIAYFLNIKKFKKRLQKIYDYFEDKEIKLKEIINLL